MGEWLLQLARKEGAHGGTLFNAGESFGHSGHLHSAHFFELADQPVGVVVVADESTCKRLLNAIERESVDIFYVKIPVQYGRTGAAD